MEQFRILIADDQVDVLEALQLLLKNEGFTTEVVTSPRAVVEAVNRDRFDILLIDLNYARDTTSGSEGLELLARIRNIDSALPVVVMTAWGSVGLAVEAMQGGGRDFIQKPWDNAQLLSILRRQIGEGRILRAKQNEEKASHWLRQEVSEAREIQERLLPRVMPVIQGCEICATWLPANDVGGDYYDAILLNEAKVAFCIADVSGKGLPAALLMANTQATVRAFSPNTESPADMCRQLNRVVSENLALGKFITMFYGVLDVAAGRLRYTNAGHVPPILARADGTFKQLEDGGTVLGAFPHSQYEEVEVELRSGDRLVLITDGITEASNHADEEFGRERLRDLVLTHRSDNAKRLQEVILGAVSEFTSLQLQDDATLLIVSMM